jgi:hypothetical protein
MPALTRAAVLLASSVVLAGCGDDAPPGSEASDSGSNSTSDSDSSETGTEATDIADALAAIDGMSVIELASEDPELRLFELHYLQPADHGNHAAGWFEQKLYLRHRDAAAPMVLFTTGYHLYVPPTYESEPATLLQANQVAVEQRFFAASRPDFGGGPVDWRLLTIAQAAADHHRIVEVLRPIYTSGWLSTGGSKGGMTSIYHRRFYPDDVDATVAYVAPHSLAPRDLRYLDWLEQIGEPECAQAVRDLQAIALARRATLTQMLAEQAADEAWTFVRLGGTARAFEAAVVESRWSFWQYSGVDDCATVPDATASDAEIYQFIDDQAGWDSYNDDHLLTFEPYYYQAATELGAPAITEPHIANLLVYPVDAGWKPVLPDGTKLDHDPAVMADISAWLSSEGERLMFVYGEWDPWSGGTFDPSGAADTHLYWVSQGSHRSKLAWLADAEFDEAVAILDAWMAVDRDAITSARELRAAVQPLPELRLPVSLR